MSIPLDDRYFEWLYGQVGAVRNRNPARSRWGLAKTLFTKEFVWLVPNDDNRAADGKDLRYEFLDEQEIDLADSDWIDLGCSVLEMLVALARRASFESVGEPADWYGLMIKNLGFDGFTDDLYNDILRGKVEECLDRLIFRTYSYDGVGSLFPLDNPSIDQRKVELWYQLSAYLLEGRHP